MTARQIPGNAPNRDGRMCVSVAALAAWVLGFAAAAAAVGAGPTLHWAGPAGLAAMSVAGAICSGVTLATGLFVASRAKDGPGKATFAYLAVCLPKGLLAGGLAVAAWQLGLAAPAALLVWTCVFYFVMLAGEVVWLVRALRQDARRVALGEIERDSPFTAVSTRRRVRRDPEE